MPSRQPRVTISSTWHLPPPTPGSARFSACTDYQRVDQGFSSFSEFATKDDIMFLVWESHQHICPFTIRGRFPCPSSTTTRRLRNRPTGNSLTSLAHILFLIHPWAASIPIRPAAHIWVFQNGILRRYRHYNVEQGNILQVNPQEKVVTRSRLPFQAMETPARWQGKHLMIQLWSRFSWNTLRHDATTTNRCFRRYDIIDRKSSWWTDGTVMLFIWMRILDIFTFVYSVALSLDR